MRNRETRDPEISRIKDKIVICPKRGPKSHNPRRFEAKVEYDLNFFANRRSYGAKKQLEEANPKNGFLRAKQALSKSGI